MVISCSDSSKFADLNNINWMTTSHVKVSPVQLLVEAGDDVGDGLGGLLCPQHVQVVDPLEHVVVHRGALLVNPAQTSLEKSETKYSMV